MNRRQLLMGASLALFLASCAAPAPAAEPAAAKPNDLGGREIVIAVENAYPPFNYKDEKTGDNIGMDYDIVNDVCKRLNCKTKFVTTSWEAIVAVMESEGKAEWDMAADGITITPERAKNVDFSDPVINVAQRLLVRKGEARFKTGDEFKANAELIFGAQPGTTNYVIMEKLVGKDRIQAYDQFGLIVQALMNNDIDATVMDGTRYQHAHGKAAKNAWVAQHLCPALAGSACTGMRSGRVVRHHQPQHGSCQQTQHCQRAERCPPRIGR